ncbi:MAG: pyruvate, phosphate dikinase [Dehalococcoidia bacterium]|nr:pyruvate, phosphate dikinase [Dehalococcoidia bacterium]
MTASRTTKWVYNFSEGNASMVNLLGGKGANLAEMSTLGLPVPPGFVITTETSAAYFQAGSKLPDDVMDQVRKSMKKVEKEMGRRFGDAENPLLVSVRSGARKSMPGMMETVLNVGLCELTIPGMITQSKDERFVYDAYRRLITMYSDVVMEKSSGIEPENEGMAVRPQLEKLMDALKKKRGCKLDTDLTAQDLKSLCEQYKAKVKEVLGKEFPDDPWAQLWGAIGAVFQSWYGKRAVSYRRVEGIPAEWGTAVNVQTMVFGNMGEGSATGVAFTRDPATGDSHFYGEWLVNAQGEDVVAGIRTPNALNKYCKQPGQNDKLPSLEEAMPDIYRQLVDIRNTLEKHYTDMQDLEFTIEHGRLWMLQTRSGKRNGTAAVRMAVDMLDEGLIDAKTALRRVKPEQLDELLHPMLDPDGEKTAVKLAKGLPAGPGGAIGKIVLNSERAHELGKKGDKLILVRTETSPEDVEGMHVAEGILTARGGMTSHAALVARGWGKCCIVGCGELDVDYQARTVKVAGKTLKEGDWISLNGSKGIVYLGKVPVVPAEPEKNPWYKKLMELADSTRRLGVRTNADRPIDAEIAVKFGAEGIGLTRTEHMFFEGDRIVSMRKMILADDLAGREKALEELLPLQREDFIGIFKALKGRPATIRFLDPPLHEFVPHDEAGQKEMAKAMGISAEKVREKVDALFEFNPMLGHRGCRLGITYPEITAMQARAIIEAAYEVKGAKAEIMIPLVGHVKEFIHQKKIVLDVFEQVKAEKKRQKAPEIKIGTMIEVPRGAVTADEIAKEAEFFSFGTNDLTQMGCGFSRDDAGKFLKPYVELGIFERDPFQTLDASGVGELVRIAVEKGRKARPGIKLGVCGEHGGDPKSIEFFHRVGLDYVSCSPFRVPIARLAAAHAALDD